MLKKNLLLLFLLFVFLLAPSAKAGAKPVDVKIVIDQKIPMADGVELSARIWRPEKIEEPLPCIFVFTPYISDESQKRGMFFARNGYVYVSVDVRGRGNSQGIFDPLEGEKHSKDIYEIVSWLAGQSWCDGQVAMRGGSYRGMIQWQAMKTRPRALKTIVPTDAVCPGIDFPLYRNIITPYMAHWLSYTSGKTGNDELFYDFDYWSTRYLKMYREHLPLAGFWKLAGIEERIFKRWLSHPSYDEYWQSCSPGPGDYRRIDIPILSITCYFFSDQFGVMNYYRNLEKYAPRAANDEHYIIFGPWDHPGTRYPQKELLGLTFGDNAVLDMEQLHLEWYDWRLKGKKKPAFLKDRVCYYVMGDNRWKYASSLDEVYNEKQSWYLSSKEGQAKDAFKSGRLIWEKPEQEDPDVIAYDPLETAPWDDPGLWRVNFTNLTDQRDALSPGKLIYHGPRLQEDLEVAGFVSFDAYISIDVPDADFQVTLYEIRPGGTSIFLTETVMRARYRDSISRAELVKPGKIYRYAFDSFDFFCRKLRKGSRLRLVFGPLNTPLYEKNYHTGGTVSEESGKDAREAVITLYHDREHPSRLVLPVFKSSKTEAKR